MTLDTAKTKLQVGKDESRQSPKILETLQS